MHWKRLMSVALLPAVEQLKLLRANKISAVELAEEHITRIDRLNPELNAIVDFDAERVRRQARSVRAGELSGLPLATDVRLAACCTVDRFPKRMR